MKLKSLFKSAATLLVASVMCVPAIAAVTVVDFGAIQDGLNGLADAQVFSETIEPGDPATVQNLIPGASGGSVPMTAAFGLSDGATISWGNVAGWNNNDNDPATPSNAGENYVRVVAGETATFTVATANPNDLVTIDFIAATGRDADITVGGVTTNIGVYTLGTTGWTNVITDSIGTTTGDLTAALVQGAEPNLEGNIGAARITITPGAAIPEPSSLALLAMGTLALGLRRRR